MKQDEFTKDNIAKFLDDHGTFSLELEVAKVLSKNKIKHTHSGHYNDVETDKVREYDFLIDTNISTYNRIVISIEVKAFSSKSAVLAHAQTRKLEQSYHCILESNMVKGRKAKIKKVEDEPGQIGVSYYSHKDSVAISLQRINFKSGKINHINDDVYGKFMQAISVCESMHKKIVKESPKANIIYIPIVVVPDKSLWEVQYNKGFEREDLLESNHVSVKCNHQMAPKDNAINYHISHFEVCTLSGLMPLLDVIRNTEIGDNSFFRTVTY